MEAGSSKIMSDEYEQYRDTHCHCVVCGSSNPASLRLHFEQLPDGSVRAHFVGRSILQGYRGILHGGIVAMLLDAAMTHCLFYHRIEAVTGELKVRYLAPVPCGDELEIRATLVSSHLVLHRLESSISHGSQILARGSAKFMEVGVAESCQPETDV